MTASLNTTLAIHGCRVALADEASAVSGLRTAATLALAGQKQTLAVAATVAEHGLTKSSAILISALGVGVDSMPSIESLNLFPASAKEGMTEAFLADLNASAGVGLTLKAVALAESARKAIENTLTCVTDTVAQIKDVVDGPMAFADLTGVKRMGTAEALLEAIDRNTSLITDLDTPISAEILGPDLYQQGYQVVTGALEALRSNHDAQAQTVTMVTSPEEVGFNDDVLPALSEQSKGLYTAIQTFCDNGGALLAGLDGAIEHIRTQEGADAVKSAELVAAYAQVVVDTLMEGVGNLSDVSALTIVV